MTLHHGYLGCILSLSNKKVVIVLSVLYYSKQNVLGFLTDG